MRKFFAGFLVGIAMFAATQAIAICFKDGELISGVNIMFMDTGKIVHCPSISFMMNGRHINCNR